MKFYKQDGLAIIIDRELGRGGEGVVYTLEDDPVHVAKIYHEDPSRVLIEKLTYMTAHATPELCEIAAWPTQLLFDGRDPVGFLCPRFSGCTEIHNLYNPKERKASFPKVGWGFLIHTALNLAHAFQIVHEHRHVIGDVNDRNILVTSSATVKLLDCDSFQIQSEKALFPCKVGMANFLPPELQREKMESKRTPNHDNFSLAVFIFNLLFMGRHPFSGRYKCASELPLPEAIARGLFAYNRNLKEEVEPPRHSLAFDSIPEELQRLFLQSFSRTCFDERPNGLHWKEALGAMKEEIKQCQKIKNHQYYGGLTNCNWCNEDKKGVHYFTSTNKPLDSSITSDSASKEVRKLWQAIQNVPPPGPLPQLKIATPQINPKPFSRIDESDRMLSLFFAIISLIFFVGFAFLHRHLAPFTIFTICGFISIYLFKKQPFDDREERLSALHHTQEHWEEAKQRWKEEANDAPYNIAFSHLRQCRDALIKAEQKISAYKSQNYAEKMLLAGYKKERDKLFKQLKEGPFRLQTVREEIMHRRRVLGSMLIDLAAKLRQAEEDWKYYLEHFKKK